MERIVLQHYILSNAFKMLTKFRNKNQSWTPLIKVPFRFIKTYSSFKTNIKLSINVCVLHYFILSLHTLIKDNHNKLWKILKEMGIPDHLTCLLRNLYAGQEATVTTGHATTDWFQIGKGVRQGCILWPCLFNLYAEYIMRKAGLEEAQAGIKIAGRTITSDMQMTPPLWQKVKKN